MADAADVPVRSERDRERDLYSYYLPWLDSVSLKRVPSHDSPSQTPPPHSSHDTTLTAFAQLAALRLNANRGTVSLIDKNTQICLAEATQTLSLVDEARHAPGDHVWFGNASLPRNEGMDEHVFGSKWTAIDANGQQQTLSALVINDVGKDERFRNRPYVASDPGVKFYAGVPVVTKKGHEIGVYAVSDIRPRPDGLSLDQVRFMQDVSQIIAGHLERVKSMADRQRDEVFVRGIASFIEGLSTYKNNLSNPVNGIDDERDKEDTGIQAPDPQCESLHREEHPVESHRFDRLAADEPSQTDPDGLVDGGITLPHVTKESDGFNTDSPDTSKDNLSQVFWRAARTIQEAIGMKGCVFLDAAQGTLSSHSANIPIIVTETLAPAGELEESDIDSEPDTRYRTSDKDNESSSPSRSAEEAEREQLADVLGASIKGKPPGYHPPRFMKRKHLHRCLKRHPFGKVFYLGRRRSSPAPRVPAEELRNMAAKSRQRTASLESTNLRSLPRQLLESIPDAKWLVFLPLFNHAQSQWCAGGFLWSDNDSAGDLEAAMPYLQTFGSCIMSEVSSMEALNTNMAKSTFIASISHDLRSPLHGMLGSLEFLEDTLTSAYQMSLLGTIETCGKTLLDTIDHLLDFAKINNLNRTRSALQWTNQKEANVGGIDGPEQGRVTFNLSLLLEEVVEAVFAGQTFRKSRLRGRDPVDEAISSIQRIGLDESSNADEQIHSGTAKFSGKVFFILNIEKAKSWCVRCHPGALQRIIMNIVGNAIKYCHSGAIEIALRMESLSDSKVNVQIDVCDTGVGMSQVFQEQHLFRAFSQEDSFTPGAGLGLSITSQIVQGLDGKIKIHSEKGKGTHVNVTLPMEFAPPEACDSDGILESAVRVTWGKRVCLLNPQTDADDLAKGRLSKLTASLARTCEEWFGMTCSQSRTMDDCPESSIYIYCEPPPIEYLLKHHSERKEAGKSGKEAALLIICTNAFEAAALRAAGVSHLTSLGRVIEVIAQPVAPYKLSKVLLQSLHRVEAESGNFQTQVNSGASEQIFEGGEAQRLASQVEWNSTSVVYDNTIAKYRPSIDTVKWKSAQPLVQDAMSSFYKENSPTLGDLKRGILPEAGSTPHRDSGSDKQGAQPPYVLLVDDNAINLKLLTTFVTKIKLPYAEAVNGVEAYEKFKEAARRFDVVLMDLQMPVMDGLEATRRIREYEAETNNSKPSTIIAITGVGSESTRKEAMEAGMDNYLTKPIRFKALRQLLEQQHQR